MLVCTRRRAVSERSPSARRSAFDRFGGRSTPHSSASQSAKACLSAGVVRFLLERDVLRDDVLLVVDDEPADKHAFADWLARACGVDPPPKRSKAERLAAGDLSAAARRRIETSKRCSNDRLHECGYEFVHPTYREGYRAAVGAYRR